MLPSPRVLVVVILAILAAPAVGSIESGPDAGAGVDAPDKRAWALLLNGYGAYAGTLFTGDEDWYRVDEPTTSPRCVQAALAPDGDADITLRVNTGIDTRTTTLRAQGERTVAAIAVPTLQRTQFGVAQVSSTTYDLELASMSVPSASVGDALTASDAGATMASATPIVDGCVGGHLTSVANFLDSVDLYSIGVAPGENLYYSVGSSGPISLTLLDASGTAVGPAAHPGELAGFYSPTGGTYYLQAARASGTSDIGYTLGATAAADPGNGCRPYCLVLQ